MIFPGRWIIFKNPSGFSAPLIFAKAILLPLAFSGFHPPHIYSLAKASLDMQIISEILRLWKIEIYSALAQKFISFMQ
jgi:hypothetical protein